MNSAISAILSQYGNSFMEKVAEKYSLSLDELQEMWKENMKIKHSKVKKTTTTPAKKRMTGYILFRKENKDLLPSDFTDASRHISQLWSKVTKEEKDYYRMRAKQINDGQEDGTTDLVLHDEVENEQQQEESAVIVSTMVNDEDATQSETQMETQQQTQQEEPKPKKPKTKRPTRTAIPTLPESLTEREAELWAQLAGRDDLRALCKIRGIKPIPKSKDDQIRAIVKHQIAQEDTSSQTEDEDEVDEPL